MQADAPVEPPPPPRLLPLHRRLGFGGRFHLLFSGICCLVAVIFFFAIGRGEWDTSWVILGLLFAVVAVKLLSGVLKLLARRRLYVHGQAVLAQVQSVHPTSTRINGRPLMRVEYSYEGSLGPCQGSDSLATPPAAGARVWVLFDPAHPKRSMIA